MMRLGQGAAMFSRSDFRTIFIGVLVMPLAFVASSCKPHITTEGINQQIAREAPRGSSIAQVLAFLDSHTIEHSGYMENPETASDFRYNVPDNRKPLVKGYLMGIMRNVRTRRWDFFNMEHPNALLF